ncbi:MAG: DnaA N-terminal domain-containing protein [Solirubrobacteraceae bacterium]
MTEAAAAAVAPASIEDRRADRKPKSHRWTRWRRELPKQVKLGAVALELASELARRADNETGECSGYQAGFAAAVGRSTKSVQRATTELVKAGVVVYEPGHHRARHQRAEPCRFTLIPLEEVRTLCPQRADTVSTPQGGQADREVRSPCPPPADGLSALTAVGTTQRTEPPQPPAGGGSSRSNVTIWESYVNDSGRTRRRRVDLAPPSQSDRAAWENVRELWRDAVGENTFAIWLEPLELVAIDNSGALAVRAPGTAGWVQRRFARILKQCPRQLRFVDIDDNAAAPAGCDGAPAVDQAPGAIAESERIEVGQLELDL